MTNYELGHTSHQDTTTTLHIELQLKNGIIQMKFVQPKMELPITPTHRVYEMNEGRLTNLPFGEDHGGEVKQKSI